MPYCPKCDMEFVDGITICSDCGGPLISTAEYEALRQAGAEGKQLKPDSLYGFEEEPSAFGMLQNGNSYKGEAELPGELPESEKEGIGKPAEARTGHAYVTKRQRYEDMRSSIFAFLLVGCLFLVLALLLWSGILRLPVSSGSGLFFRCVLTFLALACLVVAAVTRRSASAMKTGADEEQSRTAELISWFVSSCTAEDLDRALRSEDPLLEGNELELKRFELIQDRLVTSKDLPDPDYVDFLCEEIYGRLYEN